MKELINIIAELKAPKGQYNLFGKYKYRSCEDILESVKPILVKYGCALFLSDEVRELNVPYTYHEEKTEKGVTKSSDYNGSRVYIEATATIINSNGDRISAKGFAREEVAKAGMDASQITGSASSYARKYALNGLFCIDDTKDADATNNHGKEDEPKKPQQPQDARDYYAEAIAELAKCKARADVYTVNANYINLVPEDKITEFNDKCNSKFKSLPS